MATTFQNVTLEAVQETEIHRTLENDRTVTEVELPGVVNLYVNIDGGRVLLDRLSASKVLEAIEAGKQSQPQESAPAETTGEPAPQETAPEQPQGQTERQESSVADRTQQIGGLGSGQAPLSYTVPASSSFTLMGVRATLDGSSAAGDFLPCVQIVGDSGVVMAQTIGSTVTAGDSVDATFAPFLRTAATAAPPSSGIAFDTNNQGGWLVVAANDFNGNTPVGKAGIYLQDNSGAGINLDGTDAGGGITLQESYSGTPLFGNGGINIGTDVGINLIGPTFVSGTQFTASESGGITLNPDDTVSGAAFLSILNLPTTNPGGSGIVWNDAGTLKIT